VADRRGDFAWLPLLSIETRRKTGIQHALMPAPEFALPRGTPPALWASAATWRVSAVDASSRFVPAHEGPGLSYDRTGRAMPRAGTAVGPDVSAGTLMPTEMIAFSR
jgi:hypothetical protein